MLRGTRATRLKLVPDGIEIETEPAASKVQAHAAVVIADGGFQANPDMVREHISPAPDKLLQRHGGTAIGDGFAWRRRSAPRRPPRWATSTAICTAARR